MTYVSQFVTYFECGSGAYFGICRSGMILFVFQNSSVLDRTLNCPDGVLADIAGRTTPFVAVHVDTTHVMVPGF